MYFLMNPNLRDKNASKICDLILSRSYRVGNLVGLLYGPVAMYYIHCCTAKFGYFNRGSTNAILN